MLKMVSKKSMLLLGAVMALCAFVLPSAPSVASWTPVGLGRARLDSSDPRVLRSGDGFWVVLYLHAVQCHC